MKIQFDKSKNKKNIAKHGISLAETERFDFDTALIDEEASQDYGETRYIATGFLDARLHRLIYTVDFSRDEVRPISLRKANPSEEDVYVNDYYD